MSNATPPYDRTDGPRPGNPGRLDAPETAAANDFPIYEEIDRRGTLLGHPRGLFLLFLVEMWERFSYYGMRGLLVLYLIAVFAVGELRPGVYSNDIEMTRIVQAEKTDPSGAVVRKGDGSAVMEDKDGPSRTQTVHVAVDTPSFSPPAGGGGVTGAEGLGLRLQRLKEVQDPADADKTIWVPSDVAPDAPVVVRGNDGRFSDDRFAFRMTNPTQEPIKVRMGVKRGPDVRPLFRVNDSPTAVTTEIKPDSAVAAGDKPFDLVLSTNPVSSGRYWQKSEAATLYGWYTGLAYLFPIIGGIIADKLIGTHRSMLIGGLLITLGHIVLGVSGMGGLAHNATGMSVFIAGLALIVLGTGHFKPTVSVMVGQLYRPDDPRRDGAFTIFYMGINLGAFICAFICGTLGEKVGWHWGFASAAVGMLLGLGLYVVGRPIYLKGIGEPPAAAGGRATGASVLFLLGSVAASCLFGLAYHAGLVGRLDRAMGYVGGDPLLSWAVPAVMIVGILAWTGWFLSINRPQDRGPVVTIFVYMLFNAFFWLAFEQAGSSINVFTEQNTDRMLGSFEVPATWFQSINAGLIFILAPIFAAIWTALGKRRMNPSQPVKIALGLIFLGIGYIFMVWAGQIAVGNAAKAGIGLIFMTYFWHTVGELCLSPTGLAYVTRTAPVKFVSLLMGIWFISSFIANLGGGLIAAKVEDIEKGTLKLPWHFGGQADFFFLFVVTSIGAGLLILILSPFLKRLGREEA